MTNILYSYLKEIKDDLIKSISNTIMNNFIIYKQKMIYKKLKIVFNIYKKKEQIYLNKKFSQWNYSLLNDKTKTNNNYFNLNLNVGPIINNNNNKIPKKHIRNNINNFSTINNSNSIKSLNKKKRPLSSEESLQNFEEKVLLEKIKRNKNSAEKIDKFIKRQEIFYKNNYQKKEKIIKDNEDENKLIYTFEPKVNNSLRKLYKNDNLSVGKRLYNDSLIRRNKKKENNIVNIPKNLSKKSFNQKKILELYEDYNIRKEKNEKLIKKIEKECGYTYVPSVLHKKKFGQKTVNKVQNNKSKNKKIDKNNMNNNTNNTNKNIGKKKLKKNHSFTNQSLIKKINE